MSEGHFSKQNTALESTAFKQLAFTCTSGAVWINKTLHNIKNPYYSTFLYIIFSLTPSLSSLTPLTLGCQTLFLPTYLFLLYVVVWSLSQAAFTPL